MIRFNLHSTAAYKRVCRTLVELGFKRKPSVDADRYAHSNNQYGPHNEPYYAMVFYNKDRPDITL